MSGSENVEILYWIVGVCLAFCLGQWLEKWRKRLKNPDVNSEISEVRQQLQTMIEELELTASNIVVEIEEKYNELQNLIQIADSKVKNFNLNNQKYAHIDHQKQLITTNNQSDINDIDEQPEISRYLQVENLARQGMDVIEIARRLKMGTGEIRLILGLCEKNQVKDNN